MYFKDYCLVYSRGKNSDEDADDLVALFKKSSQAFGIRFDTPGFIVCDPTI
jgi:hypothetical protein